MDAIPISADPTSAMTAESTKELVRCDVTVTAGTFTTDRAIAIGTSGLGTAPPGDMAATIGSVARIISPVSSPSLRTARIVIRPFRPSGAHEVERREQLFKRCATTETELFHPAPLARSHGFPSFGKGVPSSVDG